MKDRYSILRPLTIDEQEYFAISICNFFSPTHYKKNCEKLGIEPDPKSIRPFSFGDLLRFLKKESPLDPHAYNHHLVRMIRKFVNDAILVDAGHSFKGSTPYTNCYYTHLEMTDKQKLNNFWLGNILGEEFIMEKFRSYIVRFEGEYSDGISGTGSGILINENTILTCRHNLIDLASYKCLIGDKELEISKHEYHEKHDIGIVQLKSPEKRNTFPYFGFPYELDNTLTMGYPPLRGMREAPLITQKGEINAKSKDWNNCDCITISSTVRPGNSGGPVISQNGYIVGIVTQYANSANSVSADKSGFRDGNSIPFYNAIASTDIIQIINELDNSIPIHFEDYK